MSVEWCVMLRERGTDTVMAAMLLPSEDLAVSLRDELLSLDDGEQSEVLAVDVINVGDTWAAMLDVAGELLSEDRSDR